MSNSEVRRPRRIIATPWPAGAPQAPSAAKQAERFQRALNGRRSEPTERVALALRRVRIDATSMGGAAATESPVAMGAETSDVDVDAVDSALGESRSVPMVAAVGFAEASVNESDSDVDDLGDPASGESSTPLAAGTPDDRWTGDLVRAVVTLCARTDPAMQAWSVVLPMDKRRLPSTELHLSLSQHRISLCFRTQSPHAVRLLSLHRPALATLLAQALPGDRELDIDIT